MAEKTFTNVQFLFKYDTYANWKTNNPVLRNKEPGFCYIPADNTDGITTTVPVVLQKVGDGKTAWNDLSWVSGPAADVYSWAKQKDKPTYQASEIGGINEAIANYVEGEMGISVDTDTQYTIAPVEGNAYQYKLMSRAKGDENYTTQVATIEIPKYDDSAILDAIDALELLVGETKVADQIAAAITALDLANTYDAKGAAAQALTDAKAYTDELANGQVATNKNDIAALKADAETEGSIDYKIAQAVAAIMENPDETMNSINELVTWVNDHAADALELSNNVSANTQAIDALEELVGETDVAAQIAAAIEAALKIDGVDKYALATDLTAAIARVATLEGKSHEHANKDLLDAYTQTEANLADAVAKKHEHTNKDVLDSIDQTKVDAIGTAIQTVTAAEGSGLKATKTGTGVTIDFDESVTFIFDAGDSNF